MITNSELAEVLALYPVVRSLSDEQRSALQSAALPLRAPAGDILARPGDTVDELLLLTAGKLKVIKQNGGGRALVLYTVGPGETCVLSLGSILANAPFPARVDATAPVSAVRVPSALVFALLEESAAMRRYVFNVSAARQLHLIDLLGDAVFYTVERRLARLLLSREQPVLATHQELAEALGTAREVISRTLKELETRHVLRLQRGEITVLNPDALHAIVTGTSLESPAHRFTPPPPQPAAVSYSHH
ncbi:MAG: Crp/Fnr family transcriptional regulator [Phycisphaerae bacterium]|jgi:CRP/FNR family transcriptional regulator